MDFALKNNPSPSEISDAINYLLGNLGSSSAQYNPVTGTITQNGVVIGYLYRYLWLKYATSFNGTTGFSDSPTNATYYGLWNTNSDTESLNPADYIWYPNSFGATDFFWYLVTGGRTLTTFFGPTTPGANWVQDTGAAIDLDNIASSGGGGGGNTYNNTYQFSIDGVDGEDAIPIQGPQGLMGLTGAAGPMGPMGFGMDGEDGQDGMLIQGPAGAAGGGGGGSANFGTATIDFGTGSNEASIAVTGEATILGTSKCQAFIMSDDTSVDHTASDHKYVGIWLNLTCGTPSAGIGFTIYGRSPEKLSGKFSLRWTWAN